MPPVPTPSPSWRTQQLYTLWQEGQVRISRWALGAMAFAVLVPLLVLAPYERTSRAAAELRSRIAALEAKAKATAVEANELEAVSAQLDEVVDALEGFSLSERQSDLVAEMRALSIDWTAVDGASDAQLRAAGELVGELDRVQRPAFAQASPESRARSAARGAVPNQAAPMRPTPTDDDLLELAAALDRLKIEPGELLERDAAGRAALLEARITALADERADESVQETAEAMREAVVEPLRALLESQPRAAATLPELAEVVAATEREVEAWRRRCIDDPTWYSTVEGKMGALMDLRGAMERGPRMPAGPALWTARFVALAEAQQRQVAGELERIESQRRAATEEASADLAKLASLAEKLRAILPKWLGDLVSPPELLRLYPPAMLALLGCLAALAWRVRSVFLAMRRAADEEQVALDAIDASSTWTLVRRDRLATAVTVATYLGGVVVLWALFAYGVSLASSAAQIGLETPESLVDALVGPATIPSLRLVGHAAFALAAALVLSAGTKPERSSAASFPPSSP